MNWKDWVSIIGSAGTLFFGFLSLYQWTAITALRSAIRGHAQTAYNILWNIGHDTGELHKTAMSSQAIDPKVAIARARAADASSVAGRNEVINFAREYAGFVPYYEPAWEPRKELLRDKSVMRKIMSAFN
jgi:hypothetical protein